MNTMLRLLKVSGILLLGGLLYSCAAMEAQKVADKEQILAAAGFKMKPADTPAKLAHVQSLVQNKITRFTKNGKNFFVYADAKDCQCIYAGDDAAYSKFQGLQVQQNIADQEQMTAEMNQDAEMNWGMWGPGPWGFY
jgi:hypothetical protein